MGEVAGAMPDKNIVTVTNKEGHKLYGILDAPTSAAKRNKRIGINFLNPGLKNRVSPSRLYISIVEALAQQGYYVLRMDPAGIGDSEGDLPQEPVVDLWGRIQQGLFVDDVMKMNEFFLKECLLDELVLMGSCGGAITALLAANIDRRISRVILIDIPVTLSSTTTMTDDYLHIIEADDSYRKKLLSYYLKSLYNPKQWLRFFSMKSNYKAILKVFFMKLKSQINRSNEEDNSTATLELDNFNPFLLPAFKSFCGSGRGILFLCAEKDTDTQLFNKGFRDVYLKNGNPYENRYEIHTIRDANHIYTFESSKSELIQHIIAWLSQIYTPLSKNELKIDDRSATN